MVTVNERWVIQIDEWNYTVCQNKPRIKVKDGKERTEYPVKGYFRGLPEALQFIFNEEVRISLADGNKTLAEAVTAVSRVRDEMHELFAGIMEEAE